MVSIENRDDDYLQSLKSGCGGSVGTAIFDLRPTVAKMPLEETPVEKRAVVKEFGPKEPEPLKMEEEGGELK